MNTSLDDVLDRVWTCLQSGADPGPRRSPFTMMQLATLGLDGVPKVRTVVMRGAVREPALVRFYTDVRSEKVAEIGLEPHVGLIVGDWSAGIQIRLEGVARLVDDREQRMSAWHASRPQALMLYRTTVPPGTRIDDPSQARSDPRSNGFDNFCMVDVRLRCIEFLDLSGEVHRRAQFRFRGDQWSGEWVAP